MTSYKDGEVVTVDLTMSCKTCNNEKLFVGLDSRRECVIVLCPDCQIPVVVIETDQFKGVTCDVCGVAGPHTH